MMVFVFFLLTIQLGEVGFILFCLMVYFYLLFNYYDGLTISLNYTMDFISFGMMMLSLLIIMLMTFSMSYEFSLNNKWVSLLVYLFFLILFLFFTFTFSSFLLFYMFFEFVIIPTFILIISWGYSLDRFQAALYMFFYTFLSSLPLLFFLIYFFLSGVSLFFIFNLYTYNFSYSYFYWWLFILLVFTVKLPLFIFHLWLPKAHVDAPLLGSMILAGVLLKMGGYGIYSTMFYFYYYNMSMSWWIVSYSIFGSLLMGLMCMRQTDLKSLIAFSSVVHMGPVFCCLVLLSYSGFLGSYWMMVSHGFCSACLFFMLNMVYLIMGSRSMFFLRGGMGYFPFFSMIWFFFCLSNMGFPPTLNFFSEIMMMIGTFFYSSFLMFFFLLLLLMSGFYSIFIYFFFNHGSEKFMFLNFHLFNMKSLMVFYIFFIYLMFFFLFIFFFC